MLMAIVLYGHLKILHWHICLADDIMYNPMRSTQANRFILKRSFLDIDALDTDEYVNAYKMLPKHHYFKRFNAFADFKCDCGKVVTIMPKSVSRGGNHTISEKGIVEPSVGHNKESGCGFHEYVILENWDK